MKNTLTWEAQNVVEHASTIFDDVFRGLAPILDAAQELFTRAGSPRAHAADLEKLRPTVFDALGGHEGLVVGAGFIAAPHTLADQELGFQWWTTHPDGKPTQLFISLDPTSEYFLDYTRQSWFTVPRDTGRRHVTGPYVDYLCSDEYTLTFTAPVKTERFVGVVGSDVFVREFEQTLQQGLASIPGQAALVNAQGRVIVSNSARQVTGSLVRQFDIPAWWSAGAESTPQSSATLHRCGESPIALLVFDER